MVGRHAVREDFTRRVRARRAAGIVSDESLSRLLAQYIQAFESDSAELNRTFATPKRRRGAPFGNENRRIHGYYARDAKRLRDDIALCERLLRLPPYRRTRLT